MDIQKIVIINRIKIKRKKIATPFNPALFISLIKSFEILPKQGA